MQNYLHAQVCKHGMDLAEAQRRIRTNWVEVWNKIKPTAGTADTDDGDTE